MPSEGTEDPKTRHRGSDLARVEVMIVTSGKWARWPAKCVIGVDVAAIIEVNFTSRRDAQCSSVTRALTRSKRGAPLGTHTPCKDLSMPFRTSVRSCPTPFPAAPFAAISPRGLMFFSHSCSVHELLDSVVWSVEPEVASEKNWRCDQSWILTHAKLDELILTHQQALFHVH